MNEKIRITLRADDTADRRAASVVTLLGLSGDPAIIRQHTAVIADVLAQYMEIDGVAYDPALDSARSYDAAIAAIRARIEDEARVTAALDG